MNLNGDEKRIQQLFREMGLDDQRRLPEFASILATAHSGMARSKSRIRSLRFAMAVALLCGALLIAMSIILRPSKPGPVDDADQVARIQQPQPPIVVPSQSGAGIINVKPRTPIIKRARHRRRSNQIEVAMKSLFAWQSPTASLLATPDDELLRSLPRLGESLRTIRSFSPDEFN